MARIKPGTEPEEGAKAKTADAQQGAALHPVAGKLHELARRRVRVLVILAVVTILALSFQALWRRVAPTVASRERYLVPASAITVTPPPEWIVADVQNQVVHRAGLDKRLSILDPAFVDQIEHAFALHPWIRQVVRIEKKVPPGVHVEVLYRRPVAVIDSPEEGGADLIPVDALGTRLPTEDVPLIRRKYLPRIINISGRPPIGQRWEDQRVPGAVELAVALGDVWEPLHLDAIVPSARPEVQSSREYYVYELVTDGGTRIIWGAAPKDQAPGEDPFKVKLARLRQCIERYGPLNTASAPGTVNVRGQLQVTPRIVKKPAKTTQVK